MGRYVDTTTFKKWTRSEIQTADDGVINAAIAAAEQALDNACNRRFELAGDASSRVFRPLASSGLLFIDDCTSVTAVTDGSTDLVVDDDYQLEPLNGLSSSGEPRPYNCIRRIGGPYWGWPWTAAAVPWDAVTVTATWGWPAIPPQIVEACKVMTKAILDGRDIRLGVVGFTDAGGVSEREARVVRQAVADYRLPHRVMFGLVG